MARASQRTIVLILRVMRANAGALPGVARVRVFPLTRLPFVVALG